MRIFVTGSRGFLGSFLCERLTLDGHKVTGVHSQNCDLRNSYALSQFQVEKFEQIYHLAAWTQAGDFCLKHSGEQWIINQQINSNVLAWWQAHQPQAKMICMGTSCGYDSELPHEELYYLQGTPTESLYTYAMTKRMLLVGLQAIHRQFGLPYLYFIPSTLYGPNYHSDGRQMHFIFDLMRKILQGKWCGNPVQLWGDGYQKRELVHVRHFVDAMVQIAFQEKNIILNIGAGKEHSIREFAEMISQIVGYPVDQIEYDTSKYVGARSKVLSIQKLLGFMPEYHPGDLHRGIQETLEWMQKNHVATSFFSRSR